MRTTKAQRAVVSDLREGIDYVEERDGWNWVVDGLGEYAAHKTAHYEPEAIVTFRANAPKLELRHWDGMANAVARTGMLTQDQKAARLAIMSAEWASRFGAHNFVVA